MFSNNDLFFTYSHIFVFHCFFSYKKRLEVQGTDAVISSLETFILLLTFSNEKYPYQLKLALKCAVQLCEVRREYCETFVELLGSSLGKVDGNYIFLYCIFLLYSPFMLFL